MIEILAPAGNKENLKIAVAKGANAVYLGMNKFSARSKAENFHNLMEVVSYCHFLNVKVYVALNTLIKNNELEDFLRQVKEVEKAGADAIILQDLALGAFCKAHGLKTPLHASTQCGICNQEGALFAKKSGFDRVILARETPLSEIERIIATGIEVECFCHGALCVSFSGNCYLSSVASGNSGNRGKCLQPCRKEYSFGDKKGFLLSPCDLALKDEILKLQKIGVSSLKIEGRMRRGEYVGETVSLYDKILKGEDTFESFENVKKTFNRGNYTKGYLNGEKNQIIYSNVQNHIGIEVGEIVRVKGNISEVKSTYVPTEGDGFKIILKGGEVGGGKFQKGLTKKKGFFEIYTTKGAVGGKVHLTTDVTLQKAYENLEKKVPLEIHYDFSLNKVELFLKAGEKTIKIESETLPRESISAPLTKEDLEKSLAKLGDTYFTLSKISGKIEGNLFFSKSELNSLRRKSVEKLLEFASAHASEFDVEKAICSLAKFKGDGNTAENVSAKIVTTLNESKTLESDLIYVLKPDDYTSKNISKKDFENKKVYLYSPNFMTKSDIDVFLTLFNSLPFSGIYGDNVSAIELAEIRQTHLILGVQLNVFNKIQVVFFSKHAELVTISKELTEAESRMLKGPKFCGNNQVMTLLHCPFINNKIFSCGSCGFENLENQKAYNKYVDGEGRAFYLKRIKLNGCIFQLYNEFDIAKAENLQNCVVDQTILGLRENKGNGEKGVF